MDYTVAKSDMTGRLSLSLSSLIKDEKCSTQHPDMTQSQQIPLDMLDCTDQVEEHLTWQPGYTAKLFLILDPTQT